MLAAVWMSDARLPRLFGKYVLLRPLARGGMGELYLAATGDLGGAEKLCVIKKVHDEGEGPRDPQKIRRLLDEARVMVRLNHSNLVQVFDAGQVEGELYLAMELVAGRDLRAAWNRCADLGARIPVDLALYVVREVARGLAYAHSYGGLHLVHRDIAPPNILCSWQGEVKITDFGLAASRLKSEKTGPGVVFGRLGYLAPEQARGEAADHRADIFALGVILWELLTGRPLIDPQLEPADALRALRALSPEPPSYYAKDLPQSLDQVVLRALQSRREARYPIADELRQAVGRELLRIAPDTDQGCVVSFLRDLYGDEIEAEQREYERLLQEELPKARRPPSSPEGPGGLTGLRAELAARHPVERPIAGGAPPDVSGRLLEVIDGRYRIERLLGQGGMGAVYEAEHIAIRKKVALKVLHRPFSQQADLVARFRREAQAASRVGHPNIIDVTDFGYTQDGSAYLVMEHLEGLDLGQVLEQRGRLPVERALRIAAQLAAALGAAHAAGVIHRDLKPENIFLLHPEEAGPQAQGVRDFVKVLDFGIAMRLEPSAPIRLTDPGLTVGTPAYMAPEQATGGKVDGRADIYALGSILYEMLSGRTPFDDQIPLAELLLRKTREAAPPLRVLAREVPPLLEDLVLRCLDINPSRRPQTMGELLEGLQAVEAALRAPPEARGALFISAERPVLASDPTVPFSTAEHGALLPRPREPGRAEAQKDLSPAASGPAAAAPGASAAAPALPVTTIDERELEEPEGPGRALRLLGIGAAAAFLLGVGFAAARYSARPERPAPRTSAPAPPVVLPAAGAAAALRPGPEAPLLEWARRAAEGGRYTAPPGDNLAELLARIEALSPGNEEARRLRDQAAGALGQLGRDQLRSKDADGALRSYRALSALRSDAPFPRSELAQVLLAQARALAKKNRPRALESALGAAEADPESVPTRLLLGELFLSAGQRDRAAAEFRRVLGQHPDRLEERAARAGLARTQVTARRRGKR